MIKVTQIRSAIGSKQEHRGTLRALGLGRIGQVREHQETPELQGRLRKVAHLISVEEVSK